MTNVFKKLFKNKIKIDNYIYDRMFIMENQVIESNKVIAALLHALEFYNYHDKDLIDNGKVAKKALSIAEEWKK